MVCAKHMVYTCMAGAGGACPNPKASPQSIYIWYKQSVKLASLSFFAILWSKASRHASMFSWGLFKIAYKAPSHHLPKFGWFHRLNCKFFNSLIMFPFWLMLSFTDHRRSWLTLVVRHSVCGRGDRGMFPRSTPDQSFVMLSFVA